MKFRYPVFIIPATCFFIVSCSLSRQSAYSPANKYSPQVLRHDLSILKSILEANHPSLYWYTPKDSIDYFFNTAITSIKDSLTELQFKNKVSWVVSKIRCGHTAVRSSKQYSKYFTGRRITQFPLLLKVWQDSAVVVASAFSNDSVLKRGTIVTSINGRSNNKLLDSMGQLISTDGYTENFKQQLISFNYPFYYRNTFGLDSVYNVNFIDSVGRRKTTTIKNYTPVIDTSRRRRIQPLPALTKKEIRKYRNLSVRSMTIDTQLNAAFVRISTFSDGTLNTFFKKSFKKLRKEGIKNVVIDLRENSGGNVMSSTKLTQYLIDKPFNIADTVAAISRSFQHKKYIKPWFIYWLSMHFTGRKQSDGRVHFRYFERHMFKPKSKDHFKGQIYLLTGGYTFSAATLITGALKGQKNVTVVGEETGGGSYGNSAMHLPVITLPVSKVRIVLPLYRLVIDKDKPKTGRGIFPDVEVKPSSSAIKNGIDAKLEKVKEIISGRGAK
ncbi:MAG TPA: S41 family peptidase [Segetibacter sp.]